MTDLFKTIEECQPKLPGWCIPSKASALAALVLALRPDVTLEIGVFGGSSFIPMALAHKAVKGGTIIGIDPWDTNVAVSVQPTEEDKKWWSELDMNQIYGNFMREIAFHKLEPFVQIVRQPSSAVGPPQKIDICHIDGGHDATAISDVIRFAPRVRTGGIVVLDDIGSFGMSTTVAAQRLIQMGFAQLYPLGTGACFQRIK